MSPLPDYYVSQGDKSLVLRRVLQDARGSAVDLAGAVISFWHEPIEGGTVRGGSAVNESSGTAGQVAYTFGTADTATAGLRVGEFEVTFQGGAVQTFPNDQKLLVLVTEQIQ